MTAQNRSGWGKTALRTGGGGFSVLGGLWVAKLLALPFGVPESAFIYGIGPIAAFLGFELGSLFPAKHRALGGAIALVCAVLGYFFYYWMLTVLSGGPLATLVLMVLFAFPFLAVFGAFGVFGIHVFDEVAGDKSQTS